MEQRCPACGTPVVEGFAFCGACGARVEVPAPAADGVAPVAPIADAAEVAAQAGADAEVEAATPDAGGPHARSRGRSVAATVAVLALAAALVRFGAPADPTADAATSTLDSSGRSTVDVDVPALTGELVWATEPGTARPWGDAATPWAAPLLTTRTAVAVVPGALAMVGRDGRRDDRVVVEVPVSAQSGPALLDEDDVEVAVVAAGSLWFADRRGGLLARSDGDDLADVTPVALDGRVLVQSAVGGLRLLERDGAAVRVVAAARGLDLVSGSDDDVPAFHLGVRAVGEQGVWVGARHVRSQLWNLWHLDATDLEVLDVVALGATDAPTIAMTEVGELAVAVDGTVQLLAADGEVRWSHVVGAGARVVGHDGGVVAVLHDTGRVSFAVSDGRQVSRGTVGLVDGPHSTTHADEVLVNGPDGIVALSLSQATVTRQLAGTALSVAGHDDAAIVHVGLGESGAPVLRFTPTPDRGPVPDGGGLREVPLPMVDGCRLAGLGDALAWHDGESLRLLDPADGRVTAEVDAASSAGSRLTVHDDRLLVVDARGFLRPLDRDLASPTVVSIGDDPVAGVAVDGDVVVGAGGTGPVAPLTPVDGFVIGLRPDGSAAWSVRTRHAAVSPPTALDGRVAVRLRDGEVLLLADGTVRGSFSADRRALDEAVLDARGLLLRDGSDLVALFAQGEEAWRAGGVSALPGIASDDRLVVVRGTSDVVGIDRATGSVLWRHPATAVSGGARSAVASPVLTPTGVVVLLGDEVLVLDRATGEVVQRVAGLPPLAGPAVVTGRGVASCTTDGRVVLVG